MLGMIPRLSDEGDYYYDYGKDRSLKGTLSNISGSFSSIGKGLTGVFSKPQTPIVNGLGEGPLVESQDCHRENAETTDLHRVDLLGDSLEELSLEETTENFNQSEVVGNPSLYDSQIVDFETPTDEGFKVLDDVVTLSKQWSRVSEAFREVYVAIQSKVSEECKSMLVTSADKGDGKTTVAVNLAMVYAQSGRRTVIIDADLRSPSINELIGVPEEAFGLSDYFADEVGAFDIFYPTDNESLFVIPAGTLIGPFPQFGTGKKLKDLIDLLKDDFDTIIIDGPPVLHVADGLTISRIVDGVALVVRNGKTLRDTARWVKSRLVHINAQILGVVYNDVPGVHNFSRYSY
jgi:capsular exopolysaccharide synthesis family protein